MSDIERLFSLNLVIRNEQVRSFVFVMLSISSYIALSYSAYFFVFSHAVASYLLGTIALAFWLLASAILILNKRSIQKKTHRIFASFIMYIMIGISLVTIYLCAMALIPIEENNPTLIGGGFPIKDIGDRNPFSLFLTFGHAMIGEMIEKIGIHSVFIVLVIYMSASASIVLHLPRK